LEEKFGIVKDLFLIVEWILIAIYGILQDQPGFAKAFAFIKITTGEHDQARRMMI
jgi:hypothetical protein